MKVLLSLMLASISALTIAGQSNSQKARIANEIRAVMTKQTADWNRGDIDAFMNGYWNSEKLLFVGSSGVTRGWLPTLDRYKKSYDSRAKMGTLTFSNLEIDVISRDAAVVLGRWSLARQKDTPNGTFTLIFRKFKEGWRIVHDHTT